MLEKNADVNIKSKDGRTALIESISKKRFCGEIVELLLEKGADVNVKSKNGNRAIIEATKRGYKEIVKLLLEKGADVNVKDMEGKTASLQALENGHEGLLKLLLKMESSTNKREELLEKFLLFDKNWKDLNGILKLILKDQMRYKGNHYLLITFSKTIKINKNYVIACKFILKEMITDNIILQKNLDKSFSFENRNLLKEELDKKINLLKLLFILPMEIFELVMIFI